MPIVRQHEGSGDPKPHRAGLPSESATHHARLHVEGAQRIGRGERLLNVRHE